MDAMKPPGADSPLDLFLTPPSLQQLAPPHHPMLSPRERRYPAIVSARPQKPGLYAGFCGLGGHSASVAGAAARVVRGLGQLSVGMRA